MGSTLPRFARLGPPRKRWPPRKNRRDKRAAVSRVCNTLVGPGYLMARNARRTVGLRFRLEIGLERVEIPRPLTERRDRCVDRVWISIDLTFDRHRLLVPRRRARQSVSSNGWGACGS